MKKNTTRSSATSYSTNDKKVQKKQPNSPADQSPPKRGGGANEINETAVQEFRERKKALKQTDATEEDIMTAIERTRTAAIRYEQMKASPST